MDAFPTISRPDECLSDIYLSGTANYAPGTHYISAHYSTSYAGVPNEYSGNSDTNSLWVLGHPELGDLSAYATAAHAEGYGCNAARQYSHAEGLSTTTIGKYAHTEGMRTIATYASHAEGS